MVAELSKDALYQLYRRCCGDIDEMLASGIPDLPDKDTLLTVAKSLQWPQRLERDGVIVDFTKIEILKQRETQTIANLIHRMDELLIPSKRQKDDVTTLAADSAEFSRLARLRIDVGKYFQLLLGEPTSRGEVSDEERRKKLEKLTPADLRDLLAEAKRRKSMMLEPETPNTN
jgi:hypothetical protein